MGPLLVVEAGGAEVRAQAQARPGQALEHNLRFDDRDWHLRARQHSDTCKRHKCVGRRYMNPSACPAVAFKRFCNIPLHTLLDWPTSRGYGSAQRKAQQTSMQTQAKFACPHQCAQRRSVSVRHRFGATVCYAHSHGACHGSCLQALCRGSCSSLNINLDQPCYKDPNPEACRCNISIVTLRLLLR